MRKVNTLLGVIIAIEIIFLKANQYIFKYKHLIEVNLIDTIIVNWILLTLGAILCLISFIASYETAYDELTIIVEGYDEELGITHEP